MDYTTLVAQSEEERAKSVKGMHSLYQVCQEVTDGRWPMCARETL